MSPLDLVLTALGDLRHRLFRTALAALGIICGVASVQASLCIGEGGRRQTMEAIGRLGVTRIVVQSIAPEKLADKASRLAAARDQPRYGLGVVDLRRISADFPGVAELAGLRDLRARLYGDGGKEVDVTVLATEAGFARLGRLRIERGRFLGDLDHRERTRVAVVGTVAARRLFGLADPLTRSVYINGEWFSVIGLAANPGHAQDPRGGPLENAVFIPLGTALAATPDGGDGRLTATRNDEPELDALVLELADERQVLPTAHRLERWFARTGREGEVALEIPLAVMQQKEAAHRTATLVTALIAGISLLVGGIGIMNIMLANISERRKEIGTRRALGARQRDIMAQFVIEALVLTGIGGLVGMAAGWGVTAAVDHWTALRTATTVPNLLIGFGASCLTGLVFGLWPARQAARVNPIEALRSG